MGNLLGEPFKEYVNEQIRARQKVHGKKTRTVQELQYLNSKNAWIKLASGTSMEPERLKLLSKSGNPLVTNVSPGIDLAIDNVLFNGLSSFGGLDDEKIQKTLDSGLFGGKREVFDNQYKGPKGQYYSYQKLQRSGINGFNSAYGVGGTQQYGYSPMPGILDANIKDLNRGSIKRATLNIKAHNRNQFDVIDALYLRLGYTVLLEWGNDKYLDRIDPNTGEGIVRDMGVTLADKQFFTLNSVTYDVVLPLIEKYRKKYKGNYDGMFGVVSNFSWTFEPDGSYNIKVDIISQGDVIESLKANLPVNEKGAKGDSSNGNGSGNTLANEYSKLNLANIASEAITKDEEAFYDDLYPGLEDIITEWYNGGIDGKAEFNVDNTILEEGLNFDSSIFGPNFPTLDLASYSSRYELKTGNIPSEENLDNIDTILGDTGIVRYPRGGFLWILRYLIYGSYTGNDWQDFSPAPILKDRVIEESEGSKVYTVLDDLGNKIEIPITSMISFGVDYIFSAIFQAAYEVRIKQLEDKPSTKDLKVYGESIDKENIARKMLLQNIDLNHILIGVFEAFKQSNFAGGAEDPQFASEQPEEDLSEEETAEIEAEKELEANKDKNKVFNYLYNIRKVWSDKAKNFTFSGGVKLGKIIMGSIINPTGNQKGSDVTLKPIWNKKVGFPIYPRKVEEDGKQPNAADIIRLNLQPLEKQYFIRLGVLLEYLEQKVIPRIKSGSNKDQPMLLIDYHPQNNICYTVDNLISLDPNKLIIKNKNFYNGRSFEIVFAGIKDFKNEVAGGFIYGNIMNIYLNFDRIEELFEEVDENNQVSVFEILKKIATDINESLGNVNNIEPVIDKETNTVTFIDQTSIPGLKEIAKTLEGYKRFNIKEPTLEIFGYNQTKPDNPTSNFVRSAGITTEISKEYATIITIGATANGAIPGAESTAFSKWNVGIQDRFKTNIVDGEDERAKTLKEQNQLVLLKYSSLISRTYGKLGLTKNTTDDFTINNDLISLNKNLASNYYIYAQAQTSNSTDSIESSIGFIPFNLKLEMDGLSGVKIYNRVKVNTSFLPTNYGETLSFIITGVNHKLSGNEWVTNLDTIATTKDKFSK